jgi:hypothetical protein
VLVEGKGGAMQVAEMEADEGEVDEGEGEDEE